MKVLIFIALLLVSAANASDVSKRLAFTAMEQLADKQLVVRNDPV